ncbi:MAG: hypothetical protein C7B46_11515 [Sulfobacillus benefaciens]|uniref:Uncharacterized protein n=1 Tax=Sulfobacillus benefaciens TaxID=453960 RepID=A0A2T2XET4_9FIRM|nr:MAG: hypothetical protein C7B46_11515 [Sulfobacillus benefaciens]
MDIQEQIKRMESEIDHAKGDIGQMGTFLKAVILPQVKLAARTDPEKVKEAIRHLRDMLTEIFEL